MRKVFVTMMVVATSLLLVACGQSESEPQVDVEQALQPLNVDILTPENAFEPGVEGKIEILVTEGDDPVSDADEVLFEIWEHGQQEESEHIEGELEDDGKYFLTYTFEEEGYYYVVPHVTARGKHTMPRQAFNVGGVEVPEDEDDYTGDHSEHEQH